MATFFGKQRLSRRILGGAAGTALLVAATSSVLAQRATREQTIFISVADKDGKPPASLAVTDFEIKEDGRVREVLKVEPATTPIQIAVLVDTSQVAQAAIPDLRAALRAFASAIWAKSPNSEIALFAFGERPTVEADFSTSAAAFGRGVDKLFAASGAGAYFIDAIIEASQALEKRKPARAAVVAYVDESGPEFSNRRRDHAFEALADARASLWTISRQAFGSDPMNAENRERSTIIGDVTTSTGGRSLTVFAPSALTDRFTEVAGHLHAQFAVTYGRPESLIPPEKLEVRLTRPGLRLSAPRWTNK